jgi:protein TonB
MVISRVSFPAFSAGLITLALLTIMAHLVTQQDAVLNEDAKTYTFDFWRVREPLERPKPKPDLVKPQPAEVEPPPQPFTGNKIDVDGFQEGEAGYLPPIENIIDGEASSNPGLMPLVKISPEYPGRAAAAGIEGYVVVEYTVTRLGLVVNPRVIDSYPRGYFENAALRAIQRFRYNPHQVNGVAAERHGVQQKFTFELEKNQG